MTLDKLIKRLEALRAQHGGKLQVVYAMEDTPRIERADLLEDDDDDGKPVVMLGS